ncbi:MAG TPA: hypothetical protein VFW22_07610 [Pseudolabrys sp.]|nr:hypothetical protein [Pseudolabrys sp.]
MLRPRLTIRITVTAMTALTPITAAAKATLTIVRRFAPRGFPPSGSGRHSAVAS